MNSQTEQRRRAVVRFRQVLGRLKAGTASLDDWELYAIAFMNYHRDLDRRCIAHPEMCVRLQAALNVDTEKELLDELRSDPQPLVAWAANRAQGAEPQWQSLPQAAAEQAGIKTTLWPADVAAQIDERVAKSLGEETAEENPTEGSLPQHVRDVGGEAP